MQDEASVPFLHITVLGLRGSGKTSLINSWVNNFFPTSHAPTEVTTLYYRTVRLYGADTVTESDTDSFVSVLAEIADTPTPLTNEEASHGTQTIKQQLNDQIQKHFDKNTQEEGLSKTPQPPFKGCDAPRAKSSPLLTKCHMSYMIVFDTTDKDSLSVAQEIVEILVTQKEEDAVKVVLVGNKIDKDVLNTKRDANIEQAFKFAATRDVSFFEVSASDFTCVRRLFRRVLEDVVASPELWRDGPLETRLSARNEGGGETCSTQ
eukprot:TRINITY_DN23333_c0_g1_i1.p1 TRINITY_DN23333_c0_g1~~TRINITY_DN23333_c0_g1_i1.p1  ORF type:complete len:263 (+),score=43.08 TRINITY_DN23333_c0_g1_i1:163-951(+)